MQREVDKELIIFYKRKNNMSVLEFCKKCYISKNTYYKIMNSGKCGTLSLLSIARNMNISLNEIFPPFQSSDTQ